MIYRNNLYMALYFDQNYLYWTVPSKKNALGSGAPMTSIWGQ